MAIAKRKKALKFGISQNEIFDYKFFWMFIRVGNNPLD